MFDGVNKKQQQIQAVDVEFENVNITPRSADDKQPVQKKSLLLQQLNELAASTGTAISTAANLITGDHKTPYSYEFDSNILLTCKVENWARGVSVYADFLADAKKYYKKTCLSAKYVYFFSYRPIYKELSHDQLCWYLYWRSAVREGNFIKTGLTYILLYLYEQINLCTLIGTQKVYKNIINIWKNYRQEFPRIDKYAAEWLIDFSLIHKIKINLDEIADILPELLNVVSFPEIYLQDDYFKKECYIETLINNISAYDYKKSKFYSPNREIFDLHIPKILFSVLSSSEFSEMFAAQLQNGVRMKATRDSYATGLCTYENKWKITVEYKNAYKNSFFKECVTDVIRLAENILREHLSVKSKLPVAAFPDKLRFLLEEYQTQHLPPPKPKAKIPKAKKSAEENPDIEVQTVEFNANIETASEIEKQSWDTTVTLVELQQRDNDNNSEPSQKQASPDSSDDIYDVDKEEYNFNLMFAIDTNDASFGDYEEISEISDIREVSGIAEDDGMLGTVSAISNNEIGELIDSLGELEYRAIRLLVRNTQDKHFENLCTEFLNKTGIMLESVIDEINGKAMDFIGDIVFDLSECVIIDEYKQDLLFFLREKEK